MKTPIGFLGAGKMATALAGGIVSAKLIAADQVLASARSEESLNAFKQVVPGAKTTTDNKELAKKCQVIILGVKPKDIAPVLESIRSSIQPDALIISMAAGINISTMEKSLKRGARVVRSMPNTPCLVGQSATAFALGTNATQEDGETAMQLFEAVGKAYLIDEKSIDAVTGLSGSGPAYIFTVIEAMSDAGVLAGLPRELALSLAVQTVRGSAQMVEETGEHPALLREKVTSPGGTTAAGLAALEQAGLRSAIADAVSSAIARAKEMGQE